MYILRHKLSLSNVRTELCVEKNVSFMFKILAIIIVFAFQILT